MNSNTFARKAYLTNTFLKSDIGDFLSCSKNKHSLVVDVDLLRATANEADMVKDYLESLPIKENKSVVINLDKCTFIDSTFLSAIIRFNKKNAQLKNSVKLVISDVRQFSIFKITKIDTIFDIYPTLEEAVA